MAKGDVIDVLIAEAIGEGDKGLAAVAWTIMNRAAETGRTPAQVVSDPGDYTGASNPGSATKKAMKDPQVRARVERVWNKVQSGSIPDPTGGATHYWAPKGMKGGKAPYWAKSETSEAGRLKIGNHVFLPKQAPNSALAAIQAAAPLPMPARPSMLAFAPRQETAEQFNLAPPALPLNPPMPPRASSWQEVGGPPMRGDIPLPRPRPAPPAKAHGVGTAYLAPATPVRTLRIDPLTNQVISSPSPSSRQAIAEQKAEQRQYAARPPASPVPARVTGADPGAGRATPFQTANQRVAQSIPLVGPIVAGVGAANNLLQRLAPLGASATPQPQPTTLPSLAPPLTTAQRSALSSMGDYRQAVDIAPPLQSTPVRTATTIKDGKLVVTKAPTVRDVPKPYTRLPSAYPISGQDIADALYPRPKVAVPTVPMPRMPMNPTAAMMAARAPRVVQAPPPMPRPRPVIAQPRQVQQAPARPTTGGLLGLLFGGNTSSGPISVPGGNPNITYTDPGIVNPGSGREINGIDIAFMPKAVQQSSRWNTGY